MSLVIAHYNYLLVTFLMMCGFYMVLGRGNLVRQVIGLNIFQTSVFVFYISISYVDGGAVPIAMSDVEVYANPLPHVLILTAIVVGVATTALALALVVRIKAAYDSIEEDDILEQDAGR